MLILRILTIATWSAVLFYMAPAVISLVRGKPRERDPSRLAWFCIAFVQVAGTLRWMLAPENDELWIAIYVLLIAVAPFVLYIHRSYGRGPSV